MSLYTKDSIDRLKDAVDMVELVGAPCTAPATIDKAKAIYAAVG